jgi:flagellar hook protein FlgE
LEAQYDSNVGSDEFKTVGADMSIGGALLTSVSGLQALSQRVGAAADNIANLDTVGYKATRVAFVTNVAPAAGAAFPSTGVLAVAQPLIDQQGAIEPSANPTALAIAGSGFFIVSPSATPQPGTPVLYTRAGDFQPDANGNLANSAGYYLQGWPTDANGNVLSGGVGTTTGLQTINVRSLPAPAAATSNVTIAANLPANDPTGAAHNVTVQVYDSLGAAQNLTLSFTKTATPGTWTANALSLTDPATGLPSGTAGFGPATVTFNPDGTLASVSANTVALGSFADGAANGTLTLNLGTLGTTTGLSQLAGGFSMGAVTQDGHAAAQLTGTSIDANGLVRATFSNGTAVPFARVPLATFSAPDQLQAVAGNAYVATAQSGAPLVQAAGSAGAGMVEAGALEQSTTDGTAELVTLITAKRAYSAGARVIKTADSMLNTLDRIG